MEVKDVLILGGGLAGLSTAYFLQKESWVNSITILEKEPTVGGLCRSLHVDKYTYDIGPHILFSKDKEMLELMLSMVEKKNALRRSNKIYHKGRHIQFPFENDLSKLHQEDLNYCIQSFNHNPYVAYEASNMLQFFLKTFGEGITSIYLRPYNEKIWKFDPAFMNTSMVDRIPKPTPEEIQRSAAGETVDGYLHQLNFYYPAKGGIEAVVQGLQKKLDSSKCHILTNNEVCYVKKSNDSFYEVETSSGRYSGGLVISTIPIHNLTTAYCEGTKLHKQVADLHYNSIIIAFVKIPYDLCGNHFTFTIPDKSIIFHRISKMDFLGEAYHHGMEATYMVEVTYRENDTIDNMENVALRSRIAKGFCDIKFARRMEDVEIVAITKHKYAYVIYDLHHEQNMKNIRKFYAKEGIVLNGRFGNFEYWNMDRILRESLELCRRLGKIVCG